MITSILTQQERIEWIDTFLQYAEIKLTATCRTRTCYIDCVCNARIGWTDYFVDDKYLLSDSQKLQLFTQWCAHIVYHIRMNGSKEHMELLFAMYEDDRAIRLLESFAKRNIEVADMMRKFIEQKNISTNTSKRKGRQ